MVCTATHCKTASRIRRSWSASLSLSLSLANRISLFHELSGVWMNGWWTEPEWREIDVWAKFSTFMYLPCSKKAVHIYLYEAAWIPPPFLREFHATSSREFWVIVWPLKVAVFAADSTFFVGCSVWAATLNRSLLTHERRRTMVALFQTDGFLRRVIFEHLHWTCWPCYVRIWCGQIWFCRLKSYSNMLNT